MTSYRNQLSTAAEDLATVVGELRDELRSIRRAIDQLRASVDCVTCSTGDDRWRMSRTFSLTSMAADPGADDFGERLNAVSPEVRDRLRTELAPLEPSQRKARPQADLF